MESWPAQAVLPLVGVAANKVIRHRYTLQLPSMPHDPRFCKCTFSPRGGYWKIFCRRSGTRPGGFVPRSGGRDARREETEFITFQPVFAEMFDHIRALCDGVKHAWIAPGPRVRTIRGTWFAGCRGSGFPGLRAVDPGKIRENSPSTGVRLARLAYMAAHRLRCYNSLARRLCEGRAGTTPACYVAAADQVDMDSGDASRDFSRCEYLVFRLLVQPRV
ncbi:MAG: hypothetical protein R6U98_03475 [Pirellulaceae bacterium]